MARPADPDRREELRNALGDYVLSQGLADMSLRPLAAALSTSPRMLLYHFESKERLVSEGLAVARMRQAEQSYAWLEAQPELAPDALLRRFWRWQLAEQRPFLRLFFEVYGLALQDPARFPGFLDHAVSDWLGFIASLLRRAGVRRARAHTAATVVVAAYRGLLLDVLATGDEKRTTRALALLLEALDAALREEPITSTRA
jgi:AcrR family transcriptional regulator